MSDSTRQVQTPIESIAELYRRVRDLEIRRLVASATGFREGETVRFTASGTFTKGDYPGMRAVRVRMVAGGGQGGGCVATGVDQWAAGQGGGAGEYAESFILVDDLDTTEAVTVGAGGSGAGAGVSGNAGSDSVFDTLSGEVRANGGDGGTNGNLLGGAQIIQTHAPALGGTGGTGDFLIPGGDGYDNQNRSGTPSTAPSGRGGAGGVSALSTYAANTITINTNGSPGRLYGGGGCGGHNNESQGSARSGGAGAAGVVIVTVFY